MSPLRRDTAGAPPAAHPPAGPAALAAALAGPDPDARRDAACALGGLLGPAPADDAPGALAPLLARVGAETDRTVLDALLAQLVRHDRADVAAALARHLPVADAPLRSALVPALAALPNGLAPLVPGLLADPDPDVRVLAVAVLGFLEDERVTGWLTGVVTGDADARVVAAATGELLPRAGRACADDLAAARDRFPDDPFLAYALTEVLPLVAGEPA